jgi:uncharacterized repeat protein (TIGR01451 family)
MKFSPPVDARQSSRDSGGTRRFSRGVIFTLFALACVIVTSIYVVSVIRRSRPPRYGGAAPEVSSYSLSTRPQPASGPMVLFSNLVAGDNLRNRIAVVPLESPEESRWLTRLACQRIHFAGGRGLCLSEGGGTAALEDSVTSTHAYVFTPDLQIRHDVALGGFPSRARVSPDGRYGAVTVFVAGHSYADAGFSTETTLIDLERGARIDNLEKFTVTRDGKPFRSVDFNFWGVTFAADSDHFFATLGTGNTTYLVEGSVRARRMETRRENVECPSLSPDGTRLVFKKRASGGSGASWRFSVLALATMSETPLAELRSIDDQVEWLDGDRIVYGDGDNLWSIPADGTGQPTKFLSQASSPAMLGKALPPAAANAATSPPPVNSLTLHGTDVAVTVTGAPEIATTGDQISYTVHVANQGPHDATDLRLDAVLGDDLTPVGTPTATNPGSGYGCSVGQNQRLMSCDTILLPKGATWTIAFKARAGAASVQTTRVIVSAGEPDPRADNDRFEAHTTVKAAR